MNIEEAYGIFRALSDGLDPKSGEPLSETSIFQRPEIIRALFVTNRLLEDATNKERWRKSLPSQYGKPWGTTEELELVAKFEKGLGIEEIAAAHGRTSYAIRSRLVRLGKLDETDGYIPRYSQGTSNIGFKA